MGRFIQSIGVLSILMICGTAYSDVNEQLRGIRKEIREKKLQLKKTRKVESRVSGELEDINRNLREKEESLSSLMTDLKGVESRLEGTRGEIDRVNGEAERKREQIAKRLSALYKTGEMGSAWVFFSAESIPQMMEGSRYLKAVLRNDRELFEEYRGKVERLKMLKSALEADLSRKERVRKNIEAKKEEIEEDKRKKSAYLGKIRADKKKNLALLKELEANARRLQVMVERLEARARRGYGDRKGRKTLPGGAPQPLVPDRGFGALKGRLSLPARGEIVEGFGRHKHPDFNSYTVSNGITISAQQGAEIHSVYDGQVIFADYFKGYGNMVIVDHGGGFFSLYAHASRIMKKVGAKVEKNDVVASVGDIDSTKGPVLYFEIRYQGKPVDPTPWFR